MGLFSKAMDYLDMGGEREAAPAEAASVTPISPAPVSRPAARSFMRTRSQDGGNLQIQTFDPTSFADAKDIAAWFRSGVTVIVNFGMLSEVDANKLLHFMLGLKEGLEGHIKRITPKVFVLTPNVMAINDEEDPVSGDDVVAP